MSHFEIRHTDAGKHVALVGDNGEPIMTSEVLTGHRSPAYVVDLVAEAFVADYADDVVPLEPIRMVDQRTITGSGTASREET